jgi:hypothetical protein
MRASRRQVPVYVMFQPHVDDIRSLFGLIHGYIHPLNIIYWL